MNSIFCLLCEKDKKNIHFNIEHILAKGYGNDGKTEAILEKKICKDCNGDLGNAIDKPFLRNIATRETANYYGMKRTKKNEIIKNTGSGYIIEYKTSVAHLFECIKIAFETHMKFLMAEYRDKIYQTLRKLLSSLIEEYKNPLNKTKKGRDYDCVWADTLQPILFGKYSNTIYKVVFPFEKVAQNNNEVINEINSRSKKGFYASLIQLGCWNFGIGVMICLQSLPPLVVHVSNETEKYIKEFGSKGIHCMDLRSNDKFVGFENV